MLAGWGLEEAGLGWRAESGWGWVLKAAEAASAACVGQEAADHLAAVPEQTPSSPHGGTGDCVVPRIVCVCRIVVRGTALCPSGAVLDPMNAFFWLCHPLVCQTARFQSSQRARREKE